MPNQALDGLKSASLLYGSKPNGNTKLNHFKPTRKRKKRKPKTPRAKLPVALIETPAGHRISRPVPEIQPSDTVIKKFENYGAFNQWLSARRQKDG